MPFPLPNFNFIVDWGSTSIGFSNVSGLNKETTEIKYREGSSSQLFVQKAPGLQASGDVTLTKGVFEDDNAFYQWFNTNSAARGEYRDISISLLDSSGEPKIVWKLFGCFIKKIEFTELKADASENAIQKMVLSVSNIERSLA